MERHTQEVAWEIRNKPDSIEARHAVRAVADASREQVGGQDRTYDEWAKEVRTGATSSTMAGFTPPAYVLQDWQDFNSPFKAISSTATQLDLPSFGLSISVPEMTSAASATVQSAEGDGVSSSSPTTGYLTSDLSTVAGEVLLSQQLVDRAGPTITADNVVGMLLKQSVDASIESTVAAAVLAAGNIGSVTDSSTLSPDLFWSDLSAAKQTVLTADGWHRSARQAYLNPQVLGWLEEQADSEDRPLFLADFPGRMGALAAAGDPRATTYTGHLLLGLDVFSAEQIPTSSSDYQVLVGDVSTVYVAEGELMIQAFVEPLADSLQVVLRAYCYLGVVVGGNAGSSFCVVSGSAYDGLSA